jgi:hypothetical protein
VVHVSCLENKWVLRKKGSVLMPLGVGVVFIFYNDPRKA